jgi:hypothetical protein
MKEFPHPSISSTIYVYGHHYNIVDINLIVALFGFVEILRVLGICTSIHFETISNPNPLNSVGFMAFLDLS